LLSSEVFTTVIVWAMVLSRLRSQPRKPQSEEHNKMLWKYEFILKWFTCHLSDLRHKKELLSATEWSDVLKVMDIHEISWYHDLS
jgi:hypothetical protein